MTNSININSPFGNLKFIGDLLCRHYPTTSVYCNDENIPVIVEWIDENENGDDEFIIYQSTKETLKDFISGKISHLDLINKASGQFFSFNNGLSNATFNETNLKRIGKRNLPSNFSFFIRKESLDIDTIELVLEIQDIQEEDENYFEQLKNHSREINTGLYRIHINNGSNVGHGTADTKILGQMLINFEELYFEVAKDIFRGAERVNEITTIEDEQNFILSSHTEVVIQEAASFSIYLKSKGNLRYRIHDAPAETIIEDIKDENVEENFENFQFVSDEIFSNVNSIIKNSSDVKSLDRIKKSYSPGVFAKVKNLAETIFTHKLVVDMDYYNPISHFASRRSLLPSNAHGIFVSVENTSFKNIENFNFRGKFTSITTNTGHFIIQSVEDESTFSGYFSDLLYDNISSLNFITEYNVVIEQIQIDYIGKSRTSYRNTMVSCIPIS